jgi:membrane associated rhomboid family serine protease
MAGLFVMFEVLFYLSESGLLSVRDLRWRTYANFAFFDQSFEGWLSGQDVPATVWLTTISYAFLHGGLLHLVMNTVFFLGLGGLLANLLGPQRFLILFGVTSIAGALLFSLLSDTYGPLVGASGALFGFIGAFKSWEWRYIRLTGASSDRFWRTILALTAVNVLLFFIYPGDGALAWEAHLGGFLAGFLIGPILDRRLAGPSPI